MVSCAVHANAGSLGAIAALASGGGGDGDGGGWNGGGGGGGWNGGGGDEGYSYSGTSVQIIVVSLFGCLKSESDATVLILNVIEISSGV